jgi:hypothetical protein
MGVMLVKFLIDGDTYDMAKIFMKFCSDERREQLELMMLIYEKKYDEMSTFNPQTTFEKIRVPDSVLADEKIPDNIKEYLTIRTYTECISPFKLQYAADNNIVLKTSKHLLYEYNKEDIPDNVILCIERDEITGKQLKNEIFF